MASIHQDEEKPELQRITEAKESQRSDPCQRQKHDFGDICHGGYDCFLKEAGPSPNLQVLSRSHALTYFSKPLRPISLGTCVLKGFSQQSMQLLKLHKFRASASRKPTRQRASISYVPVP